jgi:hypothetical protein
MAFNYCRGGPVHFLIATIDQHIGFHYRPGSYSARLPQRKAHKRGSVHHTVDK